MILYHLPPKLRKSREKNFVRTLALLLAGFSSLASVPASAEESDNAEITVTGIRQAYRGDFEQKEIPQAIATIEAKQLEENNILRLTDALDLNASIARQNNFGGLWDAFAVRGFTGDENLPSGYLVNGFNGGRGFGGARDVAGVERIEVLKGPAAALYGRGEPGGTVNIITKRAEFDGLKVNASGLYGSFDRIRFDADANIPVGESIAVRLIGFSEKSDSFRTTVNSKRYGLLPSIAFKLGENTVLSYELEWTRSEADFDRGIVAPGGNLNAMSRRTFLGEPGDGPLKAKVAGHQLQLQHDFSDDWSLLLGTSYRETDLEGFSSEAELAGGRQFLGRPATPNLLSRQRRFRDYEGEHFVVRGELSGDFEIGGLRNRLLVGVDYDEFDNSQLFQRFRPGTVTATSTEAAQYVINILNPVYGRFPLPATALLTDRLDQQKAYGFYLQDQISLSDALQVRIGLRYDDYDVRSLNRATSVSQNRSFNRVSPQFGLVVATSDVLSFYAAYGEGFRSNLGARANGEVFDPEYSKSFEAGAKFGLFGNSLNGTISLFKLKKRNVLAADTANPGFSIPIGKAGSTGLEFDLAGKLPGDIDLLISYAYIDAEAKADVLDPNFSLQIRSGDPLINIPKHSLNTQISKRFTIGDNRGLTVGAGVQHVGKRLGETATTFFLPSYTLVRAFANVEVMEGLEVFGDVKNLFNETYYTNSFARLWVAPGSPRTFTIGARVSF
jgi:iron complex outermembrane receptor protein